MTTGQLIKAARKNAGMTQSELAQRLKIPFQSVSQWERDLRNPKYDTLKRIAAALGVEWTGLVPEEQQEQIVIDHVTGKLRTIEKAPSSPSTKADGEDGDIPTWNGDPKKTNQLRAVICAIPSRFHNEIFQKLREIGIPMEKIVRESKRGAFIGEGFIVDELTPEEQIRVLNAINEVMFHYVPHQDPSEAISATQSPPTQQEGADTTPPENAPEEPQEPSEDK